MKDIFDLNQNKHEIIFSQEFHEEEEVFHQEDLVQLFPFGLSVTSDVARPMLILKDVGHQFTLPVAVSPIDAGVALSQSNKSALLSSPHKFNQMLLTSLNIEIKQAIFVEIKGAHQYLRLFLSGHPSLNSFKIRADEVMSLCLFLNVPLFASKAYIGRSRVMNAAMESEAQNISSLAFSAHKTGYLN